MEGRSQVLVVVAVAVAIILAAVAFVLVPKPPSTASPPAGLGIARLSVLTDHSNYLSGQAVNVTVRVDNVGDAPLRLNFSGTCQAAYEILNASGGLVYDPHPGLDCRSTDTNLTLLPDGFKEYPFTWDQSTDRGLVALAPYRVQGRLLTVSPLPALTAEADFVIEFGTTLEFTASLDSLLYHPGDVANVTVTLTNTGQAPAVMHFRNPCYDQFVVSTEGLGTVFTSAKNTGCIQVIAEIVLHPGESVKHVFRWDLETDAGTPLASGRSYEVTPGFVWGALLYQRFVTSTQTAFFFLGS